VEAGFVAGTSEKQVLHSAQDDNSKEVLSQRVEVLEELVRTLEERLRVLEDCGVFRSE